MVTETRLETRGLEDELDIVKLSQILSGYSSCKNPRKKMLVEIIDQQGLPFQDARTLLVFEYWTQTPNGILKALKRDFGETVQRDLRLTINPETLQAQIKRFYKELIYEYEKFQSDLNSVNGTGGNSH